MNSTTASRSPLEVLIEEFANNESFDGFDALRRTYLIVEDILKAVQAGKKNTIQVLYTEIDQSSVPEHHPLLAIPTCFLLL